VFFFEEVADYARLILAAAEVCSGVCHHLRLISGPLSPHGLLGVLVEQLVWVCHSARQNQPLIGASKPATVWGVLDGRILLFEPVGKGV